MEVSVFSIDPQLFSVLTLFLYILSNTRARVSPAASKEGCLSVQGAGLMFFPLRASHAGPLASLSSPSCSSDILHRHPHSLKMWCVAHSCQLHPGLAELLWLQSTWAGPTNTWLLTSFHLRPPSPRPFGHSGCSISCDGPQHLEFKSVAHEP